MTPQDGYQSINESAQYNTEIEPQYLIKESKFLLLSFLSFGIYPVWWIYKSWCFFIDKERSGANPAMRVVFNIFFMLSLLNRIERFAKNEGYQGSCYPIFSFILIIVVSLCSVSPAPFFLIGIFSCLFFLPAIKALNYALGQSQEVLSYPDEGLTTRQTVLVVIGSILWVLILMGLLFGQSGN